MIERDEKRKILNRKKKEISLIGGAEKRERGTFLHRRQILEIQVQANKLSTLT